MFGGAGLAGRLRDRSLLEANRLLSQHLQAGSTSPAPSPARAFVLLCLASRLSEATWAGFDLAPDASASLAGRQALPRRLTLKQRVPLQERKGVRSQAWGAEEWAAGEADWLCSNLPRACVSSWAGSGRQGPAGHRAGVSRGWNLTRVPAQGLWRRGDLLCISALTLASHMPEAGHLPLMSLSFPMLKMEVGVDNSIS